MFDGASTTLAWLANLASSLFLCRNFRNLAHYGLKLPSLLAIFCTPSFLSVLTAILNRSTWPLNWCQARPRISHWTRPGKDDLWFLVLTELLRARAIFFTGRAVGFLWLNRAIRRHKLLDMLHGQLLSVQVEILGGCLLLDGVCLGQICQTFILEEIVFTGTARVDQFAVHW